MLNFAIPVQTKTYRNNTCAKATNTFVQAYKNPPLALIYFTKRRIFVIIDVIWETVPEKINY